MSYGPPESLVIYMQYPTAQCCLCGVETESRWGIPIDLETAQIAANDFVGEWAGKPACELCFRRHAAGLHVGEYPKY